VQNLNHSKEQSMLDDFIKKLGKTRLKDQSSGSGCPCFVQTRNNIVILLRSPLTNVNISWSARLKECILSLLNIIFH